MNEDRIPLPSDDEKIDVELIGHDGNAFVILERVSQALKRNGQQELADQYLKDATTGSYYNLLDVTMNYVNVI
jgi:hypothetical protein